MTLSVLYYPYSRSLKVATLKKAALLFDKVCFLDSEPWFLRRAITNEKLAPDAPSLDRSYATLLEAGIIQIVNVPNIVREYDELLTANVVHDVADDAFCKLAISHSAETWQVLRERIPPSFLKSFYAGAGTFFEAISLQALMHASGDIDQIHDEQVHNFAKFRWEGHEYSKTQLDEAFLRSGYRFVVGGNPFIELPAYELPFLQASSLRVNECLIAAALEGHAPFTDSVVHDSLLRLKVNRTLQLLEQKPEIKRQLAVDTPLKLPRQHLALEILDRLVPEEDLQRRSVEDLLKYRQKNGKQFARFHELLETLSAEVEQVTPDGDYERKIHRVVSSKVLPELQKTRDGLRTSYEDAFGQVTVASGTAVVPTLAATISGGLGIWQVLIAAAMAEGAVLGVKGSEQLLKLWQARKASKHSPLAYLAAVQ